MKATKRKLEINKKSARTIHAKVLEVFDEWRGPSTFSDDKEYEAFEEDLLNAIVAAIDCLKPNPRQR